MQIIGLTGGIASGKSLVSRYLSERSIPVIDADILARKVVEPKTQAYSEIVNLFGNDVLNLDETLNREKLAQIIFSNEEKRKALNAIIHPKVAELFLDETKRLEQENFPFVIYEVPLLFENHLEQFLSQSIVVYVPYEIQLQRLMKRDHIDESFARIKILSQMPLEEKKQRADFVIDNSGSIQETKMQADQLIEKLK